jgi:4-phosphopantoate--beta-alanine ligase
MVLPSHPRYESLILRAKMVEAYKNGILSDSGLIAHGRGEAFDYLIGEKTTINAHKAIRAAAAALILARYPVISVNGNTAALASNEIVILTQILDAKLEINLFYSTPERIKCIRKILEAAGAFEVLGVEEESVNIEGLNGPRSKSSKIGVYQSDVVLVPLEDGDRTEALISNGKFVITIDLNPLSRTSQKASITIVDNIVRAITHLISEVNKLKKMNKTELKNIVNHFDNQLNLQDSFDLIAQNLTTKKKI